MTHKRIYVEAGSFIMVNSNKPLIIMIRNDKEHQRYLTSGVANFYGGFFNHFPALIEVPTTENWNVFTEQCGTSSEEVEYSVELFREPVDGELR